MKARLVIALLVSAFLTSTFLSVVSSPQSFAASGAIGRNAPQTNSSNKGQPWFAVGRGSFNGPYSWTKIYVPIGSDATITVTQDCGSDLPGVSPRVTYTLSRVYESAFWSDDSLAQFIDAADGHSSSGSCVSSRTLKIPKSATKAGYKSQRTGHERWVVFYLRAELARGAGDIERSYRVQSDVGYVGVARGVYASDKDQGYFNVYNRRLGSGNWNYWVQFAATCQDPDLGSISWWSIFDADQGVYQNDLNAEIYRSSSRTSDPTSKWIDYPSNRFRGDGLRDEFEIRKNGVAIEDNRIYKLQVNNMNWRNTIQVELPFDQIDALPTVLPSGNGCSPPPKNWTLDNQTEIRPGVGSYDDTGTAAQKRQKAKAAFQNARFRHSVQNLGPDQATAAEQKSTGKGSKVQYRVMRGNSAGAGRWSNSQNSNSGNAAWQDKSTWQAETRSRGGQFFVNDDGSNTYSVPRSDDLAYLVEGRTPVAKGARCTQGTAHCARGADNVWRYDRGDIYCERVVTTPNSDRNGSMSGSVNSGASNCIELGTTSNTCLDWDVWGGGTIKKIETSGEYDTGATVDDAWVDDRYGFDYTFGKTGHAESTANVAFRHVTWNWSATLRGAGYNSNIQYNGPIGNTSTGRWAEVGITPDKGGQWISDGVDWTPDKGFTNCTTGDNGSTYDPWLSVYVPYYYHITSNPDVQGATTMQQGETINTEARFNLPDRDNGGDLSGDAASDNETGGQRRHTYSDATNWKMIEFTTSDIQGAKNAVPQNRSGGSGNCAELQAWGVPNLAGCGDVKAGTSKFKPQGTNQVAEGSTDFSYTRPGRIEPVGTNVCFVAVINRPTHNANPAWRYSTPRCKTVVKSPKVQFKNGDVTVGRPVDQGGGGASCTQVNANIRTTTAPNVGALGVVSPGEQYLYGSWVEYGAFATGSITAFGTSGEEAGNPSLANRLAFTNENASQLGRYKYNSQCLSNLFATVSGDVNNISASDAADLQPHTYFNGKSDKKGYVSKGNNIKINPPISESYKARVTITGASEYGNDRPGTPLTPAIAQVAVSNGTSYSSQSISVTSQLPSMQSYSTDIDLGVNGYRGPQNTPSGGPAVTVRFANNNHNNFWDTDSSNMTDRNLTLRDIKVEWIKVQGGVESVVATTPVMNAQSLPRTAPQDYYPASNAPCSNGGNNHGSDLWLPSTAGDNGYTSGNCYGIHIDQSSLGFPVGTPPPAVLNDAFDGFRGRDIIIYAQKRTGSTCDSNPGSSANGNIYLNTDIDFTPGTYSNIKELPRVVLLADCHIIIGDNVKRINASLVAGESLRTCTAVAKRDSVCNENLTVNGLIQTKNIYLWRTAGADITNLEAAKIPAETFDLRPDQILSAYDTGDNGAEATPRPAYQIDLPPRY